MIEAGPEFSRQIATIQAVADNAEAVERFFSKAVLLTGEPTILSTPNGRDCFLNSALLLMKMTENLTIHIPKIDVLETRVPEIVKSSALRNVLVISEVPADLTTFEAILNVGTE